MAPDVGTQVRRVINGTGDYLECHLSAADVKAPLREAQAQDCKLAFLGCQLRVRVKGVDKEKGSGEGREGSPQAILKLLGWTRPLMTGLQGQLGRSGFVMNSTTWLGLLFPSELYAATWRTGTNNKA